MAFASSTIAISPFRGASRTRILENYFNYFTEIEEQFRKCRSEPVLLSPLDWALVDSWKEQNFPLEAVLAGIARAFEKFKAGKRSYRKVNTLAYCSQEVFRAVEESRTNAAQEGSAVSFKRSRGSAIFADRHFPFLRRLCSRGGLRRQPGAGQRKTRFWRMSWRKWAKLSMT
jgi:hypothetical protein